MTSGVFLLLLQMTDDPKLADRAWGYMGSWTPPFYPSQMQMQADRAVQIARGVENPSCHNDPVHPTPHPVGSNPPLGPDGLCVQCGQPKIDADTCTCSKRYGRHSKWCAASS